MVAGGVIGYGITKKLADMYEGKATGTVTEEMIKTGKDLQTGLALELAPIVAGKTLVRTYGTKTAQKIESLIRQNIAKALRPTVAKQKSWRLVQKYANDARAAVTHIVANKSNLEFDLGTVKGQLPKNLSQFGEAIDQSKKEIFKQYDDMARAADEGGLQINLWEKGGVMDELNKLMDNKALKIGSPRTIAHAKAMQKELLAEKTMTAVEAQEFIALLNQSTKASFKNPSMDTAGQAVVDSLVANHLREALEEGVKSYGGQEYLELRKAYGSLTAIEDEVARAIVRDMGKGAKGLIDFSDIFTSYVAVESILKYDPARFAAAGGARTTAAFYKYLNNPNVLVRKMFQGIDKIAVGQLDKELVEPIGRKAAAKAAAYMTVRGRGGREDAQIEYTP
jgi:hypothetical protein